MQQRRAADEREPPPVGRPGRLAIAVGQLRQLPQPRAVGPNDREPAALLEGQRPAARRPDRPRLADALLNRKRAQDAPSAAARQHRLDARREHLGLAPVWHRQTRIRQPPLLHGKGDPTVRPRERRPRIPNPDHEHEPSSKRKPTQRTELASPSCSHARVPSSGPHDPTTHITPERCARSLPWRRPVARVRLLGRPFYFRRASSKKAMTLRSYSRGRASAPPTWPPFGTSQTSLGSPADS